MSISSHQHSAATVLRTNKNIAFRNCFRGMNFKIRSYQWYSPARSRQHVAYHHCSSLSSAVIQQRLFFNLIDKPFFSIFKFKNWKERNSFKFLSAHFASMLPTQEPRAPFSTCSQTTSGRRVKEWSLTWKCPQAATKSRIITQPIFVYLKIL